MWAFVLGIGGEWRSMSHCGGGGDEDNGSYSMMYKEP